MPRLSRKSVSRKSVSRKSVSRKSLRGGARKSKKSKKSTQAKNVPEGVVVGYCLVCKKSHEMSDVKYVTAKNGAKMAKGKCPTKGNGMARILARK